MSRASRPAKPVGLPPLLAHVIRAAQNDARLAESDHAAALQALARLFMLTLPARGVLALDDDLCQDIDDIAKRHLDRAGAEKQFHTAISCVASVQQRDAIETAHAHIVNVSELAHYYAGLAAGITLAELGRTGR
jgi:hypothetical protein